MAGARPWSRWNLSRRLRAALAALVAVLLVAGTGVVLALLQADRAISNETERIIPARVAASQLLTSLVDQQNGLRGFALTGESDFLAPYRDGLVVEQRERAELDRYIQPGDKARLALLTVDSAITAWRDQYASLHTTGQPEGASEPTLRFGRELFDRVRRANQALDAELAHQVAVARTQTEHDRQLVLVVLTIMGIVVAAAVIGLQHALETTVLRPLRGLGEQVAVVSAGEHTAAIAPLGPPDVQEIAGGVEQMRGELVSALAQIEEQRRGLEHRAAELARSNADLEQFAYVASHDLQEPLRKVASFCQLLEQRYGDQLDERGHQYIEFAVDGARRMQLLISDLLTFSRVGRTSAGFAPVDIPAVAASAWHSLEAQVEATQGELRVHVDPEAASVVGDASLLQLLLTNLFSNALKYRRADTPPVVDVRGRRDGESARFDVADNGIGIPADYADRVFVIFQRLHTRDEYEGTGIGLALAKKIVEFHGGTIEVVAGGESGACLSFTLPIAETAPRG